MHKRTTKLLAVILSLILTFSVIPITIFTAIAENDGIFYYSVSNGEATITGLVNRNYCGAIEIPSTIGGYPVTSIGAFSFELCNEITNISLPDSITSIGCGAFEDTKYYFNESNWEDGVLYIGNHLIEAKQYISGTYCIKPGTKTIAESAFGTCNSITNIFIPNSVSSIGRSAFSSCTSLKSVTLPNGLTLIEESTFSYCNSLTSIIIPDSVKSIGSSAFMSCSKLTDVYYTGTEQQKSMIDIDSFPSSLGYAGFNDNLLNAIWHYNTDFSKTDGMFYYFVLNEEAAIIDLFNRSYSGAIEIPPTIGNYPVTSIGAYSFKDCSKITRITMPHSVTSIGGYAFYNCTGLTSVHYQGIEQQWNSISIDSGNSNFTSASRTYCTCDEWLLRTAPTCTKTGVEYGTCSICGEEVTRTIAPCHSFTNYVSDNNATCTADGTKTAKCDRCDATDTIVDTGSKLGHNYTSTVTPPTCTEQGYTTYTCSRCGNSYVDNYTNALGHSFGEWTITKAPTCTEKGVETRICANDKNHIETRDVLALGHDYIPIVTPPTCTEQGYTTYTCSRCGDSYVSDYANALGHIGGTATCHNKAVCTRCGEQYGAFNPNNHDGKTEIRNAYDPTCTVAGYTGDTYCLGCGNKISNGTKTSPLGHSFTNYVSDNNATCTSDGTKTAKCDRCDATDTITDTNSKLGHDWEEWVVITPATCATKGVEMRICANDPSHTENRYINALGHDYIPAITPPTCTEQGYTTYTCSRCGNSYVDNYTNALGHNFGEWIVTKSPTCTEKGVETSICENDNTHTETRDVLALGHDYIPIVTPPTCTEQGYTTYTCSRCGDSYISDYTDALGHIGGTATCHSKAVCTRCGEQYGEINPNNHDGKTETRNAYDPTCTQTGYTGDTYCLGCGTKIATGETISALDHAWGVWVTLVPATCTTKGAEMRICANDPSHVENRYIDELGHDYKAVITPPTCTEQGYTTYTCSRCGDSYISDYTNALGHTGGTATCHSKAVCDRCGLEYGEYNSANHTGRTEIRDNKPETCTENGYTGDTYCLSCGAKISTGEIIAKLGHDYVLVVTPPTCTEQGYTTYTCSRCDGSWIDDYTDALGHNYSTVITPPTCTEQGYTTHTCSRCGDSYADDYTDMLGHTDGEWESDENGHWHICTVCNQKHDEAEHIESDWITDKSPSIYESGLKHKECAVCGKVLETEIIPDTHTPGDIDGDGEATNQDLIALFQHLSGWDVPVNSAALDIDGDGEITNQDLILLFQKLSGWNVEIF